MTEFDKEKKPVEKEINELNSQGGDLGSPDWYLKFCKKEEFVMDLESARVDFGRFIAYMNLRLHRIPKQDDNTRREIELDLDEIVREIRLGHVIIDDTGQLVYTPQSSRRTEPLTFRKPKSGNLAAMDRKKQNADVAKQAALIAELVNVPQASLSSLAQSDAEVLTMVLGFFFI